MQFLFQRLQDLIAELNIKKNFRKIPEKNQSFCSTGHFILKQKPLTQYLKHSEQLISASLMILMEEDRLRYRLCRL